MHNLKNLYRGSLGGHVCLQCRRYATKKTHYEILGVSKTATEKEIKSAYIELSKKYHPDTSGTARSKRKFTEINEAYSVLGKPLSRREYDNEIAFKNAQTSSSNTYGPHSRPPGSGPGGPPPPGYQYRQGYDQQSKYSSDYSSYEEYRRRRDDSELRQRFYHFYGEDGKENRRRAREASYKEWSKEENQREFRRLTAGLMLFALFMTVAKAFASGQMEVRRKELSRSPSDELKAKIQQNYELEKNVKDITPPTS